MEFEYAHVGPESGAALRKADDGGWLRLPGFFDASENVNVAGPKITQFNTKHIATATHKYFTLLFLKTPIFKFWRLSSQIFFNFLILL